MDTWEKRHAVAQRHVDTGRCAIDHQRSIIASQKAHRLNSEASQVLLAAIEQSQKIFESNLARLLMERERVPQRLMPCTAGSFRSWISAESWAMQASRTFGDLQMARGTVKWFNGQKGYGFIQRSQIGDLNHP